MDENMLKNKYFQKDLKIWARWQWGNGGDCDNLFKVQRIRSKFEQGKSHWKTIKSIVNGASLIKHNKIIFK